MRQIATPGPGAPFLPPPASAPDADGGDVAITHGKSTDRAEALAAELRPKAGGIGA